jgi:magnesium transporter
MLVNCVVYENGVRLQDIELTAICDWVDRPGAFVWVALKDATEDELVCLQAQFGLHDLAVEDARKGHQRPKLEEYEDVLFAVLHLVDYKDGELCQGEVDVFVGRNFVVSVRSKSEQQFLGIRARAEREPELLKTGPGYVFYALCDAVVDRYFPVVEALEAELESIEAVMFTNQAAKQNIQRLYELKSKVGELRHSVVPLAEAFSKLFGGRVPAVVAKSGEYFRDVDDHLLRVTSGIDRLRETISTAIQVNFTMVTVEQSDVSKKLAAWAAIFAVVTALAGIWGMNFEHMPELKWQYGYPIALGMMVAAIGILYHRFRKIGWL